MYPLDGIGLQKDFSRHGRVIPAEWILAQRVLRELSLALRLTDQSCILEGDVSLSHVMHICNHRDPQTFASITGVSLRSLRSKGVRTLADVGEWSIDRNGRIGITTHPCDLDKSWSSAVKANWARLTNALHHGLQIDDLVFGPVHFSHPFLGTYEVHQFLDLGYLEGTHSGMVYVTYTIPWYCGMATLYHSRVFPHTTALIPYQWYCL